MDCKSYPKYRPNETTAEKAPIPPEAEKKAEQQAKSQQVSVYDFAEIMKGKKAEERVAASGGEKPAPVKNMRK